MVVMDSGSLVRSIFGLELFHGLGGLVPFLEPGKWCPSVPKPHGATRKETKKIRS